MFEFLLQSALSSIRRTPVLSLLIVATVALGIGVSIPMMTVYHHMNVNPMPGKGDALYRVTLDNWSAERPFREPNDAPPALTLQDARNLAAAPGPVARAGMYAAEATINPDKTGMRPFKTRVRVTESGFFEMFEPKFLAGSGWDGRADANKEAVAVISQHLSQRLFGSDDAVGSRVIVNGRRLTVVGVLAPWQLTPMFYDMQDPFATVEDVFVPLALMFDADLIPAWWRSPYTLATPLNEASFEKLFSGSEIAFVQYWAQLPGRAAAEGYRDWLDGYINQQKGLGRFPRALNNHVYDVGAWIEKSMQDSKDSGGVVALIVVMLLFFVVCLLNTVNLLLTKFMRATGRICTLRALGASRNDIFVMHVIEVSVLAIVGGLLGIGLALFGLDAARSLFEHGSALTAGGAQTGFWRLDGSMAATAVALALIGGLAAGLWPAWKACRIAPASGLKSI